MNFTLKTKIISFFFVAALFNTVLFANGNMDSSIENTIKTGSAKEIKSALKKNETLIDYRTKDKKDNLLHIAVNAKKDADIIEMLLKYGVSADHKNTDGVTPLMEACKISDQEIIKQLLCFGSFFSWQKRKSALKQDKNGKTAFDYAADRPEVISFLEAQTKYTYQTNDTREVPDIDLQTTPGATVPASSINTAPLIIEQEEPPAEENTTEDPQIQPEESIFTFPLPAAEGTSNKTDGSTQKTEQKNNETITNTKTDIKPVEPEPPFFSGAENIEIKKYTPVYLFDVSEDETTQDNTDYQSNSKTDSKNSNTADKNGKTPLMNAAAEGNTAKMYTLIQDGADVNAKDNDGWNAAMFCIRYNGTAAALRLLSENGADLRSGNHYSVTPLLLAARYSSDADIFTILLKGRNPSEDEVRNAFISAVSTGKQETVLNAFLKTGVPLNQLYDGGKTPLMYAAQNNSNTQIINFLLKNGAEKTIKSKEGKTAFDYAAKNRQLKHDSVYWALNTTNGEF